MAETAVMLRYRINRLRFQVPGKILRSLDLRLEGVLLVAFPLEVNKETRSSASRCLAARRLAD